MITVKIQGGLGNQMFQYAFAKALNKINKKEICLNLSTFTSRENQKNNTYRYWQLDDFNLSQSLCRTFDQVSFWAVWLDKLKRRIKKDNTFCFNKKEFHVQESETKIGYWCSEKYFDIVKEEIRKDFTLKNKIENQENTLAKKYLDWINMSPISISINVRRGDYASDKSINNYHGLLFSEYFKDGLQKVLEILKFRDNNLNYQNIFIFVFSDDIEWCKKNLEFLNSPTDLKIIFMPPEISASETLYLIGQCQHNIIANSTFSWWGAWLNLNKDKIVIRPQHWMAEKSLDTKDVCPASWIFIPNNFDLI